MLLSIISGVILIFPVIFILLNGIFIGFFFGFAKNPALFLALIPHGIFEIPAFLIAAATGMRLGFVIIFSEKGKTRVECLNEFIRDFLRILILIMVLLMIAAVIEVTISAKFASVLK